MSRVQHLHRLADKCPDYPSLHYPDLPQGEIMVFGEPVDKHVLRRAVLASPELFITMCLGYDLKKFHRAMILWALRHPVHMIEAPRGFGKSTIATTCLIIILVCRDFDKTFLVTSERDDQATGFLREIRGHLETSWWLIELFGKFVGRGKWTDHKLEIRQKRSVTKEGTVDAIQMGGAVTGGHWHGIFPDDPTSDETAQSEKRRDKSYAFYFSTLKPCLRPGAWLGVRCTRYHYDDLPGLCERTIAVDHTKKDAEGNSRSHVYHWEDFPNPELAAYDVHRCARMKVLKFSAITRRGESLWEDQFPLQDRVNHDGSITQGLLSLKAELGTKVFNEQYMMTCEKVDETSRETVFKEKDIVIVDRLPQITARDFRACVSVDPAWTSKEKAATKTTRDRAPAKSAIGFCAMKRDPDPDDWKFILADMIEDLMSVGELLHNTKAMVDKWAARMGVRALPVRIERTGLQIKEAPEFYQSCRRFLRPHPVVWDNPKINKVAYATPLAAATERGDVAVSAEVAALGLIERAGDFPFGKDTFDAIDMWSGAWHKLWRPTSNLRNFSGRQAVGAGSGQRRGGRVSQAALKGLSGSGFRRM